MPFPNLLHSSIFRLGTSILRGGRNARLSILIYHRVLPRPDPMRPNEVYRQQFREQMRLLADHCNVLPLQEAVRRLQDDTLPPRPACITFDDGYRDNVEIALPILLELGLTATFFIASGYLGSGLMFNDAVIEALRSYPHETLDLTHRELGLHPVADHPAKVAAIGKLLPQVKYLPPPQRMEVAEEIAAASVVPLPRDLMMNRDQVRQMRESGMTIGGHTRTHPILANTDDREATEEISRGKKDLEAIIGERITLFAYPNGKPGVDYREHHADMVRQAGFEAAVSTEWGVSGKETDRFQLARFTPWDRAPWRFGLRLVSNGRHLKPAGG